MGGAAVARAQGGDVESKDVVVDVVASPLADEPLISGRLAGVLEIAVEDFAEGLWRFRWEPLGKLRRGSRLPGSWLPDRVRLKSVGTIQDRGGWR